MKLFAIICTLALSVRVAAQYTNQSIPFYLILESKNPILNGKTLVPCHEGAAIEGLCLGAHYTETTNFVTYLHNTTYYDFETPKVGGVTGLLTYTLHAGNAYISEPMFFSYIPVTNVAIPLFYPSSAGQPVGFDHDDRMYITGYDDTAVPLTWDGKIAYYRWFICQTEAGYVYNTLAWQVGLHHPQNPTCIETQVKRIFILRMEKIGRLIG